MRGDDYPSGGLSANACGGTANLSVLCETPPPAQVLLSVVVVPLVSEPELHFSTVAIRQFCDFLSTPSELPPEYTVPDHLQARVRQHGG